MSYIKNYQTFLRESLFNKAGKREYVADVQVRIIVTTEKDPKGLVLKPEDFMSSHNAKRLAGQPIRVATHAGQFVKQGAYGPHAYKGMGNEQKATITLKNYFTLSFTPEELQNGVFRLTLDSFPETMKFGDKEMPLQRVTTFSDYTPGSLEAFRTRAKLTQAKGMEYDLFLEHGTSQTIPVKGDSITCQLSGPRNVIYLVYAPASEVEAAMNFRFNNTFEYNSTKINTESDDYKETLQSLVAQLKKGVNYQMVVHGNASKVPTRYQSKIDHQDGAPRAGNEALAYDRAKAMLTQLRADIEKAGVKFDSVIKKTKITSGVSGDEYNNDASEKQKYERFQFVEVRLNVTK